MDFSKFPPHVQAAFEAFAKAREELAYQRGLAEGEARITSGLKALSAFLPNPVSAPLALSTPCPTAPIQMSHPAGGDEPARRDSRLPESADAPPESTDTASESGKDFDLDDLVAELGAQNDPHLRQLVLKLMWTAVVEAYQARGEDPTPVLEQLRRMVDGGGVEAASGDDEMWMAWQAQTSKRSGKLMAVWDGEGGIQRKNLYGKQAEQALAGDKKRGHSTVEAKRLRGEAQGAAKDFHAKLQSGELFADEDWDDFSHHLQHLTGNDLKELRGNIKKALEDRARGGILKAGPNKAARIENLNTGVKRLIQHAIERADLPEQGLDENRGKLGHLVGQMGGIRPKDDEFAGHFGMHPDEAVANGYLPKGAIKKGGRRFSDLAGAFHEEGHLNTPEGEDQNAAFADALMGGRRSAQHDHGQDKAIQDQRTDVATRLKLAQLKRRNPKEYQAQLEQMAGLTTDEEGGEYPASWDEVAPDKPEAEQNVGSSESVPTESSAEKSKSPEEDRAEFARAFDELDKKDGNNFVNLADLKERFPHLSREQFHSLFNDLRRNGEFTAKSRERVAPMSEREKAVAMPEEGEDILYASRRRKPDQLAPQESAEKSVDQMSEEEKRAELKKLMAEQADDDASDRKPKKKVKAVETPTETPPVPAKSGKESSAEPEPERDATAATLLQSQGAALPSAGNGSQVGPVAQRESRIDPDSKHGKLHHTLKGMADEQAALKEKLAKGDIGKLTPDEDEEPEGKVESKERPTIPKLVDKDTLAEKKKKFFAGDGFSASGTDDEEESDLSRAKSERAEKRATETERRQAEESGKQKEADHVRKAAAAFDKYVSDIHGQVMDRLNRGESVMMKDAEGHRVEITPKLADMLRLAEDETGGKELQMENEDGEWEPLDFETLKKFGDDLKVKMPNPETADGDLADQRKKRTRPLKTAEEKKKAGRKSLASKADVPFESRLNKESRKVIPGVVEKYKKTGKVILPKPAVDSFASAPDKDKLSSLWTAHIKALAEKSRPENGNGDTAGKGQKPKPQVPNGDGEKTDSKGGEGEASGADPLASAVEASGERPTRGVDDAVRAKLDALRNADVRRLDKYFSGSGPKGREFGIPHNEVFRTLANVYEAATHPGRFDRSEMSHKLDLIADRVGKTVAGLEKAGDQQSADFYRTHGKPVVDAVRKMLSDPAFESGEFRKAKDEASAALAKFDKLTPDEVAKLRGRLAAVKPDESGGVPDEMWDVLTEAKKVQRERSQSKS